MMTTSCFKLHRRFLDPESGTLTQEEEEDDEEATNPWAVIGWSNVLHDLTEGGVLS